jgi:hypothetical protein
MKCFIDHCAKVLAVAALTTGAATAATTNFGDTKVSIGGYIKSDLSFTTNGVDSQGNLLFVRQHASTADKDKDTVSDMTASESRISIKTDTNGFKTHIEGDFLLNSNATNEYVSNSKYLRLRHAYLSDGNWLIGQTWSTFMDLSHLSELLDFSQHASTIFVRQNQLRYTMPMGNNSLMLALENSATLSSGGSTQTSTRPDIIARYNVKGGWGSASAGVLLSNQYNATTEDKDNGVAFSLTAKIKTFGKDDLRLQFNSGALGRYMGVATYASFDGKDAVDSTGFSAAYRHFWTEKTRSNIMFSHTEADDAGAELGVKDADTLHVNFLWDVAPKTRIGVEFQNTDVTKSDGSEVDVQRYQFSARRIF